MDALTIKQLIEVGLPDAKVEVWGDDGQHFDARVASSSFKGKTIVEQHRMVYATLGDSFKDALHALSLTTLLPE